MPLVGGDAPEGLRRFNIRKGFFGAHGISLAEGLTDVSLAEAEVKRPVVAMCRQAIAVLDATKWGRVRLPSFASLEQVHRVITDECVPADLVTQARALPSASRLFSYETVGAAPVCPPVGDHRGIAPTILHPRSHSPMPPLKPLTAEQIFLALIEEQQLTRDDLLSYLRQIMEIRALENNISSLLTKGVLKGASHLYAGEEAVAVGAVAALRDDDFITSTHRGHGHATPTATRLPNRRRPSRNTTTR